MVLISSHNDLQFGIGDSVRVTQKIKEGEKTRLSSFEGIVISIKGRRENQSFTVRRIGAGQIGIERIYPVYSPTIEKIEVLRSGLKGVRHAKLYYIRNKSKKEIEKIYRRTLKKDKVERSSKKTSKKSRKSK